MAAPAFGHKPVMAAECLAFLGARPGGVYVDGTVGGAGHAALLYERLGEGARLICIDRDAEAVEASAGRLGALSAGRAGARIDIAHANYVDIEKVCGGFGVSEADGVLLDLGVSSRQLDDASRGFSFRKDAPLDMRMDASDGRMTAADVVNGYAEPALRRLLQECGEERWAARIARRIADRRERRPFSTTADLAGEIEAAVPAQARHGRIHPATRSFLAIRIEVNGELAGLPDAIDGSIRLLAAGGRLCVLTFHSLEDRIVKELFRRHAAGCICPKGAPVCVCGHRPDARLLTRKPARPSADEVAQNPRARSAKLRAIEKLEVNLNQSI